MQITQLDHLVLTVANINQSIDFYTKILGMQAITFGDNRKSTAIWLTKKSIYTKKVKKSYPMPNTPLDAVMTHLQQHHITIIDGIVPRTGALGKIYSIYIRDPDGNLIEISRYAD